MGVFTGEGLAPAAGTDRPARRQRTAYHPLVVAGIDRHSDEASQIVRPGLVGAGKSGLLEELFCREPWRGISLYEVHHAARTEFHESVGRHDPGPHRIQVDVVDDACEMSGVL